ncbi:MAG: hypothetical protein AB7P99_19740 [Vicinamibacterales bacterium]
MHIKIPRGTAREGEPTLCQTCKWAMNVTGARLNEEIVQCNLLDRVIPFRVTSCTRYVEANHPSVRDMEEIAWILRSDAHRRTVGFVPSRKLKYEERFALSED